MTNKSKIFIGCGIAFLIPVLALTGLIFYISSDKEYTEQFNKAGEEGKDFGKTTDQNGCIEQGFMRMADVKNPTISQLAVNGSFVEECLETSKPSSNFCQDDIPKLLYRDWINNQCEQIGKKDDIVCFDIIDEKRSFCTGY